METLVSPCLESVEVGRSLAFRMGEWRSIPHLPSRGREVAGVKPYRGYGRLSSRSPAVPEWKRSSPSVRHQSEHPRATDRLQNRSPPACPQTRKGIILFVRRAYSL